MRGAMLELDEKFPEIHSQCDMGNFAVELSDNAFSRTGRDRVIEMTLNKDEKILRGTKGFFVKPGCCQTLR